MPAIMDDPTSPPIYRVSGAPPYPDPTKPSLPLTVLPRRVTLRDRQTVATVVPFASSDQVPASLLRYLSDQFAKEIEGGDTYPMIEPMPLEQYTKYWFQNFAAVMLLGNISGPSEVVEGEDWSKECLGSFYIKPNYPGRSSHVCNAGFLVTDASRNRGVGRLMGESYLDWAPKLGYTYSVFNLVYETNVASCKIWDALGFKRIGRVKGCGNLKSYPDRLIDAIIYGRELGDDGTPEGPVSEERFDKIKFYLKFGRYPDGSDRAEKSRLRSAATHYKLLDNDVLMLKDKEVISDPAKQMEIARQMHEGNGHSGINKTTATIAEKYHWSRIKETVSDVIRLCSECKELGKTPLQNGNGGRRGNHYSSANVSPTPPLLPSPSAQSPGPAAVDAATGLLDLHHQHDIPSFSPTTAAYANPNDISSLLNPAHPIHQASGSHPGLPPHNLMLQDHTQNMPINPSQMQHQTPHDPSTIFQPIDPQIISQPQHSYHAFSASELHHHSPHLSHSSLPGPGPYDPHLQVQVQHQQPHHDPGSFQALLHSPDSDPPVGIHHADPDSVGMQKQTEIPDHDQEALAMDRDLDMLIDHDDDEMEDVSSFVNVNVRRENDGREGEEDKRSDDDRTRRRKLNWDHVVFDVAG